MRYKKAGSAVKINAVDNGYSKIRGMTMIYMCGMFGFAVGFGVGQVILFFLLRGVSREDMLNDKHIQLKYGLLNWAIALLSCYGTVRLYQLYT